MSQRSFLFPSKTMLVFSLSLIKLIQLSRLSNVSAPIIIIKIFSHLLCHISKIQLKNLLYSLVLMIDIFLDLLNPILEILNFCPYI